MTTAKVSTMKRAINEEKVVAAHALAVQKERELQARMRRAFKAWDKIRETVNRYEKILEKAAKERAEKASRSRRVIKVKLKEGISPSDAGLAPIDDIAKL